MRIRVGLLFAVIGWSQLTLSAPLFAAEELPVKRVVLFTSGVAFFQREGEVTGDIFVQLSFRTEQINDLDRRYKMAVPED